MDDGRLLLSASALATPLAVKSVKIIVRANLFLSQKYLAYLDMYVHN